MVREVTVQTEQADIRFRVPLYTLAEAARVLDVPATTFATWARGYDRRPPGRPAVRGDAIVTALPSSPGKPSIPFIGLAEGMVLAAVRRAGVPMQRVRPALFALAKEIGVSHALASQRLYTDGAEVLYDHAVDLPDGDAVRDLVVVRSGQRVFVDIIADYLRRITYGPDGYAVSIRLPSFDRAEVVADPTRAFGQPIFRRGAAPVRAVLERFWAGDDIDTLAKEFGVPAPEIEDVLRVTSRRAA